jgi:hypothetical protein
VELEELNAVEQPEPDTIRKLPWLIDVFCYPISVAGLLMLAFYLGVPVLFQAVAEKLRSSNLFAQSILVEIVSWHIYVPMMVYLFWYVGLCVRESASGRTRAPEPYSMEWGNDFASTFWQTVRVIFCFIIFWGPFFISAFMTWGLLITSPFHANSGDLVLISSLTTILLLAFAIVFFPMSLLATVMFESFAGLNPILMIRSIFSTFFSYCGLLFIYCIIFGSVIFAYGDIRMYLPQEYAQEVGLVFRGLNIYLLIVSAHLLGAFFRRNEEKLYWDV